jgi:hypothetical protein
LFADLRKTEAELRSLEGKAKALQQEQIAKQAAARQV